MREYTQFNPSERVLSSPVLRGRAVIIGFLGGLAATAVMDILLMALLWAAGMPPFTCYTIVGDTIAKVFSIETLEASIPLGATAHYLIGPLLGALFGLIQRYFSPSPVDSRKRAILFAVLYAEVVSQPLLALPPILLGMDTKVSLMWFGGSFAMHFFWGCVFGVLWNLMMKPVRIP